MADIEPERLEWVWPDRIALGKLNLLTGEPDTGKSTTLFNIAASVSTGGTFPDGAKCEQGNVIILSAEDGPSDTIRPRLDAAGADNHRIFLLDSVRLGFDKKSGLERERSFNIAEDLPRLEKMIEDIGGVRLIVVDPLNAYLGNFVDTHRDGDIRTILMPLCALAERYRAAIVGLLHYNKDDKKKALLRISGGIGFAATARMVYVVMRDPGNPDRRLFLWIKGNITGLRTGLAFKFDVVKLPTGAATRCLWEAGAVEMTADEAVQAESKKEIGGAIGKAMEFLQRVLEKGPMLVNTVQELSQVEGISGVTLKRAKDLLAIKITKETGVKHGRFLWSLPEGDF